MRHLWNAALNLLYPPACCACGRATGRPGLCPDCSATIATPASPLCSLCGAPFQTPGAADHLCGHCIQRPPAFGRARACALYDAADMVADPLKVMLQRYKYSRDATLAPLLAQLVVDRCPLPAAQYDVIMPVPLHLSRLRWRGFNQAHLIAQRLARAVEVPNDATTLRRTRATRPQVELNETERRRNVARAFAVLRPDRVRGRRILLLDDVYTTGATVNECSRVLRRAGALSVDVLVLARAVLH